LKYFKELLEVNNTSHQYLTQKLCFQSKNETSQQSNIELVASGFNLKEQILGSIKSKGHQSKYLLLKLVNADSNKTLY